MKLSRIRKIFYYNLSIILGPKIVAWFLYHKRLRKQIDPKMDYHFILCSRNIFSKDIKELKKHIDDFNFIIISNSILNAIQSAWVPKHAREQSYYYNLLPKESKNWKKCEIFSETLILLLEKKVRINGVISANFDYWQDAGFRKVCIDSDHKFIVLRRENEVTNASIKKELNDRYAIADIGYVDLVLVFSERCKDALEKVQTETLKFNRVVVTGPPRLDNVKEYLLKKDRNQEKNGIVVFSYVNSDYGGGERNFWGMLNIVNRFTIKNRLSLRIKCKSNEDLSIIKSKIKKSDFAHENIEYLLNVSTAEAIENSLCAISFGSTVLSELLTMPIDIIIPFIDLTEEEENDAILHDADIYPASGVHKEYTYENLEKRLKTLLTNSTTYSFEQRTLLRDNYLSWNPNDLSSERVRKAIVEYCSNPHLSQTL